MHTKGTLDRELFMEGGHQSHADPEQGMMLSHGEDQMGPPPPSLD